jgi:hypothetical protein
MHLFVVHRFPVLRSWKSKSLAFLDLALLVHVFPFEPASARTPSAPSSAVPMMM